jgi:hypothetical protein
MRMTISLITGILCTVAVVFSARIIIERLDRHFAKRRARQIRSHLHRKRVLRVPGNLKA